MKFSTRLRVLQDAAQRGGARARYWAFRALLAEVMRLNGAGRAAFRREVIRRQWQHVAGGVRPIEGETALRMRHAVEWILRAQRATPDDGVSLGYFPCTGLSSGWRPSYPETTGYIISTLLSYARLHGDVSVASEALRMADWEIVVQMPSGAVQGGAVCAPEQQTAASFNTGMVLDGWCSAFEHSQDPRYLAAAGRAADFLVEDLDEHGHFQTNGQFVSPGEVKTYTCLCAWALYRLGNLGDVERYRSAAVRAVEAALRQQRPNGWFAHNCLNRSAAPLTHTIGYTMQGVLEVGALAGRADFVDAVRRTADALIPRIREDGYLPGRFFSDWEPAAMSSCLTGSAQIAIVLFRLTVLTGEPRYERAAHRLINFLKALQTLDGSDPDFVGAIAGSFPLFGGYMRAGYPNWATKYFVDALMLQSAASVRADADADAHRSASHGASA